MEPIDDYRLLVSLSLTTSALSSLVLIDTENNMGRNPIQTNFSLPYLRCPHFVSDRGGPAPFPLGSPAPFHHDPSQRIIAFSSLSRPRLLVLQVGALLELSRDRGGTEIRWDEWKNHLTVPYRSRWIRGPRMVHASGCQLIFVDPAVTDSGFVMEVYDFSVRGRAKCLSNEIRGLGVLNSLSSVGGRVRISLGGVVERS